MALRDSPVWNELVARLRQLVERAGAEHAVVADVFNDLWCHDSDLGESGTQIAFKYLDLALRSSTKPPKSGGIDLALATEPPYLFARSLAGVYVLIIWFERPYDASTVRALAKRALPKIESLTVALPPPDGPDAGAGSGRLPRP